MTLGPGGAAAAGRRGQAAAVEARWRRETNVSLYVCMSAENSKMLVFVCFFNVFSNCRLRKKHKMLVFMEYVCM